MNESLKALCSGHIFALYSPAAHLPGGFSKSDVFLFYRPGPNNAVGKIYVAGASGDLAQLTAIATTMTEEQLVAARLPTIDAARLSAVTLDKATAELKAAASVSADLCFQFGTPEMSLSLSADSKETRDHWTQGLLFLMTEAQKTAGSATAVVPASPTSAAAAAAVARRFSFDVKDPKLADTLPVQSAETMNRLANNDAQLLSIPALDFVSMMLVGRNFGFYADMAGKATRFPVFLFYKFEQGTPGFLYWCNPGTRTESPQTCLPLAKIDRLYVGKQVAVFTPEAKEDCCFTLLTPEAMVNLEAGSASQASAWLYAIDAALRGYSQRRFHHTEADPKAQRYYVDGVNAPNKFLTLGSVVMSESLGQAEVAAHANDAPAAVDQKAVAAEVRAETTAAALAMSEQSAAAVVAAATAAATSPAAAAPAIDVSTAPAVPASGNPASPTSAQRFGGALPPSQEVYAVVQALKAGNNFVQHTVSGPDTVAVHYQPDATKAGSLAYESLAHHGAPKRIPLQNISDLFLGKQAAEFQTAAAQRAEPLACLTITYRVSADASAQLCLEGKTKELVDFWVHGLHAIIQHAMNKPVVVHDNGAGAAAVASTPVALRVGPSINVGDVKLDFASSATGGIAIGEDLAPSSPRARLPIGSDADLSLPTDVLAAMLAKGRTFTRWSAAAEPASEAVTVTYKKDETKSGSFYFSDGKTPRFPLHAVTDVVLGKAGSADFASAAAAGSPDDQCVTFVTAGAGSLALEAESKEVLSAWLSALTALLKAAGKDLVLNEADADHFPLPAADAGADAKSAPAAARRFTVVLASENMLATAAAALADAEQLALLTHGTRFSKYEKEGEPVWVTYVRDATRSGSLYWCGLGEDPRANRAAERALPVHTIADVYFGKQTLQFTSFAASREPEELCVSIVARDGRSLNLAAASAEQLSAFLLALQAVLVQSGKKVVTGDEKQLRTQHARRFSVVACRPTLADKALAALNPAAATVAVAVAAGRSRKESILSLPAEDVGAAKELTPAELSALVTAGVLVRRFDAAANAVSAGVRVFHGADDTKIGSLYWSEDGSKPLAPSPAQRFPLDTLQDVVLGVTGHAALADHGFDDKRTATLVFASGALHVEAATAEELSNFLLGVHHALTNAGAVVVTEDVGRIRKFSVVSSAADAKDEKNAAAAAPAAVSDDAKAAIAAAAAGAVLTGYTIRGGAAQNQKVRVVYVAGVDGSYGRLYWSAPDATGAAAQTEQLSVSVADISEVAVGRKATKPLTEAGAAVADEATAVSFVTATRTLSVTADSAEAAKAWETAVAAIVASASPIADAASRALEDATLKAESLSPFGGAPNSPTAKDALQLIHTGNDFKAYKLKGGRAHIIPMFLFYEPTNPSSPVDPHTGVSFGELYWAAPGSRAPKPKHHIKLSTVTDLYVGKHQEMLVLRDAPADVTDDRCFTIVGTDQTLSVEAPTRDVATAWVGALTYILQRHGRDILVQDEEGKTLAPNAVPARRRVSFLPFEVSAPGPVPNVSAAEVGQLFAAGRSGDVMSQQTATEVVAMMRHGRKFTAFLENHARTLLLFFAPSPVEHREGPGRLYWSHPSQRVESPLNSLLLTAIQEYSLGKSAKAFQIPEAKGADPARCFSLTTKYGVFCFEAASAAMRDAWIAGINYLLVSSGNKKLQLVAPAGADQKDAAVVPAAADVRYCLVDDVNLEALSASTFELARQMVSNPRGLAQHTDAALRLMREGNYFFAFFFTKQRQLLRHKIFVFFKPSVDRGDGTAGLGTLFWNERENYAEHPVRRLTVNDITDIYVGKHSSPFRHEKAADVPDNSCFSLVSTTKTLNLQAPSPTVLNVWLLGLNALINGARKDVSLRENDRNAAAAAQAAQATAQAGSWLSAAKPDGVVARLRHLAANYTADHNAQVVKFMADGTNFVKFTPGASPAKQVVSLFFRAGPNGSLADGTLHWSAVGDRTVDPARTWACSSLREVHLLKSTAAFRIAEAVDAPEDRCVTLTNSHGVALALCAATTDELNVWLYGLLHLVARNDKTIAVHEEGVQPDEVVAAQPVLAPQVVEPAKVAAVFDLLHRGAKFFAYEAGTKPGEIRKRQVFVYVEDDAQNPRNAGALVWRSAAAGSVGRAPLADITDIFVGKRTKLLLALKTLDDDRCLTVVTPTVVLNLEADSRKQVAAWVFGLFCALKFAGRPISGGVDLSGVVDPLRQRDLAAKGLDPARSLLRELESDASVEHTVRTLAGAASARTAATEAAVRSLIAGRVFTAYSAVGNPKRESVFVTYEPSVELNGAGALRWVAGEQASAAGARLLPLDKVSDIHLGKQSAAFRTVEAADADPERCLSLLSDDLKVALHLEARSAEAAKTFLVAVNTAIAVGGRDVVLLGAANAASADRRFAVMTSAAQPKGAGALAVANRQLLQAPLHADTVALITRGAAFTAHSVHAPHATPAFVFYKADTYSRGGALYWCELGKRSESVERRVAVDAITHITIGKSAAAFQTAAAAGVADALCLSVYAGRRALHVAAANADVVQVWFVALTGLLASLGKTVNDDHSGDGKYVVMADPQAAAGTDAFVAEDDDEAVGVSLATLADVVVWEGYLRAKTQAGAAVHHFFRLTSASLAWFGTAADSNALGAIPLGAVLRVKTEAKAPTAVSVLVSGTADDRVVRLTAPSVAAAASLATQLRELAKNQRAFARLDVADLASPASLLFATTADAKAAAAADDDAAAADEKWPAPAPATATLTLTIGAASFVAGVKPNSVLSVVVNAAGHVVESKATVAVDEDGLAPRQRVAFAQTVTVPLPLAGAAGKARNLLVDVTVLNGADVVGHWTNGQSEDVADWSVLPHPQVVASFWAALADGFKTEASLLSFDASAGTVGTVELSGSLKPVAASAAAAAGDVDEKGAAVVASPAAAEAAGADEIVLALSPEETMQLLADRPAGSLTAEERADALRVITAGQTFTRYSASEEDPSRVTKEEVFVFYSAGAGAQGSFFWCPAGQRVQSFKKRLPLAAITGVSLGKTDVAKTAVHDRVVTLQSGARFALTLEARSAHHLTAFLTAVHAIKAAAGKRVVASTR